MSITFTQKELADLVCKEYCRKVKPLPTVELNVQFQVDPTQPKESRCVAIVSEK